MYMKEAKNKHKNSRPDKPNIFSILKPYSGMIVFLIIMALLSNGINLLIPKIIGRSIDAFSAKQFDVKLVVIEFLGAAIAIFVFTYLQNII